MMDRSAGRWRLVRARRDAVPASVRRFTARTRQNRLRAAAPIRAGTPLARIDTTGIARRVEALPPVRQASIERHWPRTVVIKVTERSAVAVVAQGDDFVLLDETGTGYARLPVRPPLLPLLRVPEP